MADAQSKQLFSAGAAVADKTTIPPGSLFVLRGSRPGDWVHAGIVIRAYPELMLTIEGNTNGDGSPEGNEVWQMMRYYRKVDFVYVDAGE